MLPFMMTWRLMATVVSFSDTGSVAMVSDHSDWPSERACIAAIEKVYKVPREPDMVDGHRVTFRAKAICIPVQP